MRKYAPEKTPSCWATRQPGETAADEPPASATLIVRTLATGRDMTFGNVAEFEWQNLPKQGKLLAIAIGAEDKTGNGVQLFDAESGTLRVLDSSSSTLFRDSLWRKKSADLAVLKSISDEKRDGAGNMVLAWTHLGAASGESAKGLRSIGETSNSRRAKRVVTYHEPPRGPRMEASCSWASREVERQNRIERTAKDKDKDKDDPELPSVDVWHWRDIEELMPRQKLSGEARAGTQHARGVARGVRQIRFHSGGRFSSGFIRSKMAEFGYAADWSAYARWNARLDVRRRM